jgi:murein DD-endopeptidase MepM/ murein hydrolase activator NlpD
MKDDTQNISLWQRMRHEYRISIINEKTLAEHGHLKLTVWGAIVLLTVIFLVSWLLFSLVILFTPIRNYLPGYSENIRQQLIEESTLVDSLGTSLELQRQYLNTLTQVIAGEAPTDSIQSLDSMQIIMKEKLLEAKSEATAEFIAQYEETEKDNLQLFETVQAANTSHPTNFISPIHGTITTPYEPLEGNHGITITSFGNKNASAVMEGTIIHITYDINTLYTITVQHSQFVSIYTNLEQPLKDLGEHVKAGEALAIVHNQTLGFQLWKNGETINPEEFIIF